MWADAVKGNHPPRLGQQVGPSVTEVFFRRGDGPGMKMERKSGFVLCSDMVDWVSSQLQETASNWGIDHAMLLICEAEKGANPGVVLKQPTDPVLENKVYTIIERLRYAPGGVKRTGRIDIHIFTNTLPSHRSQYAPFSLLSFGAFSPQEDEVCLVSNDKGRTMCTGMSVSLTNSVNPWSKSHGARPLNQDEL
ncbi:MAG: hypothetical protein SGARI_004102, partial [Bacillariaceae sp.]